VGKIIYPRRESGDVTETIHVENGFLCISNLKYPIVLGGIRMLPDVREEEVALLAQAMEYKLASFGIPIGGAKAGAKGKVMNLPDLIRFLEEIRGFLTGDDQNYPHTTFITGPDMGTSEDLYFDALRAIGLDHLIRKGLLSQPSREFRLPMDNVVTGLGVVVAAEEIFSILSPLDRGDDPLRGKTYALEGFGKVATGIAQLLKDRCHLRALSTIEGSIFADKTSEFCDENGFLVEKLIQMRDKYGDSFVIQLGLPVFESTTLFTSKVDFIIPGARTEVITEEIASWIIQSGSVSSIVPASNYPYTDRGLEILERNGVICCPDFLSNSGAVLAAMIEFTTQTVADPQESAMDIVHQAVSIEMRDLLIQGIACGCAIGSNRNMKTYQSLYKLAIDRAMAKRESTPILDSIQSIADDVVSHYSISL